MKRARAVGVTSARSTSAPSAFETTLCATTSTSPGSMPPAARRGGRERRGEIVAGRDLRDPVEREGAQLRHPRCTRLSASRV